MKRIILIIVLICAAFIGKAQQDSIVYDTIVLPPPQYWENQPMYFDSTHQIMERGLRILYDYGRNCQGLSWETLDSMYQYEMESSGPFAGVMGLEGVAQPFHLDSAVHVIGVAAKVSGGVPPNQIMWSVYDNAFNRLGSEWHYIGLLYYPETNTFYDNMDSNGYRRYYFYSNDSLLYKPVNDFYIALEGFPQINFERNVGGCAVFNFAMGLEPTIEDECFVSLVKNNLRYQYDTVLMGYRPYGQQNITDTLFAYGGSYENMPYMLKNGEWMRLADDSIYSLLQCTFFDFLPIISVRRVISISDTTSDPDPDTTNSLSNVIDEKDVEIFPNPADKKLTIKSKVAIKSIEIINGLGVKIKEQSLNVKEVTIDIDRFPSGNYIINIITPQGAIKKKFVKK
jgi:hypothetical protein